MLHISITATVAGLSEAITHHGDTKMEPWGLQSPSFTFSFSFSLPTCLPRYLYLYLCFFFFLPYIESLVVCFCQTTSDLLPSAVQQALASDEGRLIAPDSDGVWRWLGWRHPSWIGFYLSCVLRCCFFFLFWSVSGVPAWYPSSCRHSVHKPRHTWRLNATWRMCGQWFTVTWTPLKNIL